VGRRRLSGLWLLTTARRHRNELTRSGALAGKLEAARILVMGIGAGIDSFGRGRSVGFEMQWWALCHGFGAV